MHLTPKWLLLLATAPILSASLPIEVEREAEPAPAPADYGNYGKYGDYGSYPPPPPENNPYGTYASYGSYKREAEAEVEDKREAYQTPTLIKSCFMAGGRELL